MRWQNAQLNTSLAQAWAASERAEKEASAAQAGLAGKVETLSASAERSAAEIARLRQALEDAQRRLEVAVAARGDAEGRRADLQAQLQRAEARSRGFDEQLAALQGQVVEVANARDRALQRVTEMESAAQRLQVELAAAEAEAERVVASRSGLEHEVGLMRAAASSAADAARQNLLAVEARIRELNTVLAAIEPAAGETAAGTGAPPALVAAPVAGDDRRPAKAAAAVAYPAEPHPGPSAARLPQDGAREAPPATEVAAPQRATAVDSDLELIKSANAAEGPANEALLRLVPDLPLEMRLQVQGLLVDLGAKLDGRTLKMTVPGASLFASNSDTIEPTAFDTLAKVAELIDAYRDREVIIVGHTDSIGDEDYNQTLSRRRAELVKRFFVDHFDLEPTRLSTDGRGEAQPIAANDTVTGRQANRRVEVLILD